MPLFLNGTRIEFQCCWGAEMKTLKERIEIETAYLNGGAVEQKNHCDNEWEILTDTITDKMVFFWMNHDYRIKTKPLEFYVNIYNYPFDHSVHEALSHAEMSATSEINVDREHFVETIKVREVIDDE